jgi:heavy metal sensor kinase
MMRNPIRSTRVRLALIYTAQFAVVVIAAAAGFWAASSQFEYNAVDAGLRAQGNAVRATVAQGRVGSPLVLPTRSASGLPVDVFVVGSSGSLLAESATAVSFQSASRLIPAGTFPDHAVISTAALSEGTVRVLVRELPLPGGDIGGMILVRPINDVRFRLVQSALLLVLVGTGLIVACSILAWRLTGGALAPVREMSTVARAITEQDLHRRLPEKLPVNDEIGQLARTFNAMLERLDLAFDTLQRFTADAAHELRAPISIMRTKLEVTMQKPRSVTEYMDANATLLSEVKRLGRITDQLLLLARADAGALQPQLETLAMGEVLEVVIDRWRPAARAVGVTLMLSTIAEGSVDADPDLLGRVFDNLIDNALRHAGRGGAVMVAAQMDESRWTIRIADSGRGVADELRGQLFERFSRGDTARGRSTGGAGLGLSICEAIVRLHRGSIELAAESALGGATFVVHVPTGQGDKRTSHPAPASRPEPSPVGATRDVVLGPPLDRPRGSVVDSNIDVGSHDSL